MCHFRIKKPEYYGKITHCDTGKGGNGDMCFYNCRRWSLSQILTQMIKIIFDSYIDDKQVCQLTCHPSNTALHATTTLNNKMYFLLNLDHNSQKFNCARKEKKWLPQP